MFTTNSSGAAVAGPVTNAAVAVNHGLFTTTVDFGPVFIGASNWLEIAVSTSGANAFTTLAPRQQLTPVPYALVAANVSGPIAASALPDLVVTNNAAGLILGGAFSGDGSGLSSVNACSMDGLTTDRLWKVGGNAGANPTQGAFLGTPDEMPFELRVHGQRVLMFSYDSTVSGSAPNVIGGFAGNHAQPGIIGRTIGGGGGTNSAGTYPNLITGDLGLLEEAVTTLPVSKQQWAAARAIPRYRPMQQWEEALGTMPRATIQALVVGTIISPAVTMPWYAAAPGTPPAPCMQACSGDQLTRLPASMPPLRAAMTTSPAERMHLPPATTLAPRPTAASFGIALAARTLA